MVTRGDHVNGGCCFDYGNAETDNDDDGRGTMEALYFGTWGDRGKGKGPWVMADMECVLGIPPRTVVRAWSPTTAHLEQNSTHSMAPSTWDAELH